MKNSDYFDYRDIYIVEKDMKIQNNNLTNIYINNGRENDNSLWITTKN